ncbi:hypothetical protein AAVH_20698 [Aphelenchoides avenae]|nr:hypothetical protein AAVH_20698 [Aphelenchus avenae]
MVSVGVGIGVGAMPDGKVECDDEFWNAYNAAPHPEVPKDPWLDELTALLARDYHVRFYVEAAALAPLLLCFAISLSRRIDSFGVKIFCWNCCLVNGAFACYLAVRYVILKFVYKSDEMCYYYNGQPEYGYGITSFQQADFLGTDFPTDVANWTVYSMALSFFFLRYSTYRACKSPLTYKATITKTWWVVVLLATDSITLIMIPCTSMSHGFDIHFGVKAAILGTFACALWVAESIMTVASVYVIWLHRRQRQAESSKGESNLGRLTSFLCFSILPCVQMVPSVSLSLMEAVRNYRDGAARECIEGYMALTTNYTLDELNRMEDICTGGIGFAGIFCKKTPYVVLLTLAATLPEFVIGVYCLGGYALKRCPEFVDVLTGD